MIESHRGSLWMQCYYTTVEKHVFFLLSRLFYLRNFSPFDLRSVGWISGYEADPESTLVEERMVPWTKNAPQKMNKSPLKRDHFKSRGSSSKNCFSVDRLICWGCFPRFVLPWTEKIGSKKHMDVFSRNHDFKDSHWWIPAQRKYTSKSRSCSTLTCLPPMLYEKQTSILEDFTSIQTFQDGKNIIKDYLQHTLWVHIND